MPRPISALILDRDGTLNAMVCNPKGDQDSPYFKSQLMLYPKLADLLQPFCRAGIPLFIVTNQPGMAKGHFNHQDLVEMHQALEAQLAASEIIFKEIKACPHLSGDGCTCRKPAPGMILEIQKKHRIDLTQAVLIGDSQVDLDAAKAAGVGKSILVRTFVSDEVPIEKQRIAFPNAPKLAEVLKALGQGL